jgi:hypothetical protein
MTNLSLYGLLGAGLWILGVASSGRVDGISALIHLFLLDVPLPLSLDQIILFSILPVSVQSVKSLSLDPDYVTGFCDASKKLVVFGTNLQSTVGEKFTRKELATVILAPYYTGVIVGLILSDG